MRQPSPQGICCLSSKGYTVKWCQKEADFAAREGHPHVTSKPTTFVDHRSWMWHCGETDVRIGSWYKNPDRKRDSLIHSLTIFILDKYY